MFAVSRDRSPLATHARGISRLSRAAINKRVRLLARDRPRDLECRAKYPLDVIRGRTKNKTPWLAYSYGDVCTAGGYFSSVSQNNFTEEFRKSLHFADLIFAMLLRSRVSVTIRCSREKYKEKTRERLRKSHINAIVLASATFPTIAIARRRIFILGEGSVNARGSRKI